MSGKSIDADQRLTLDVDKLTTDLAGLVTGMVKPLVDILWWAILVSIANHENGSSYPRFHCDNSNQIHQVYMENEALVWTKRSCHTICLHVTGFGLSESCIPWFWSSLRSRTRTWRNIQVNTAYVAASWQSQLVVQFKESKALIWWVFFSRFMHSRLRTHAESIAFFGGGSREKAVSPIALNG